MNLVLTAILLLQAKDAFIVVSHVAPTVVRTVANSTAGLALILHAAASRTPSACFESLMTRTIDVLLNARVV